MVDNTQKYTKVIDFSNHKIGLYDLETFKKDWGSEPKRGIKEKRCRIIRKEGQKLLEITIPKGTTSNGGSFWRLKFPKDLTDATFEYDIMFGKNFDFVRGGKLPGLGGGTAPGANKTPEEYANGFSARLMWREIDFENEILLKKTLKEKMKLLKEIVCSKESYKIRKAKFDELGLNKEIVKLGWLFRDLVKEPHKAYLVQYMYYPERKTNRGNDQIYRCGDKKSFVEPNKWYNIKVQIKLSEDPKKKDLLTAWVNGRKTLDIKMNLRNKDNYGINQVMFSLFFGGEDETFNTAKDEKVYFRRFVVGGK